MNARCSYCFLLILPACAIDVISPAWVLGGNGESCTQACSKRGQQCTSKALHRHNSEVNSEREMAALIGSMSGTCTSYNLNYGSNTDIPTYKATDGTCYVSDITRDEKAFSCDRSAPGDKQRLCWCHNGLDEDAAGVQKKDDDSGKLSSGVIVWIISGNMLFIGFAFMCCGVVRRLVKKSQGKAEGASLTERPADPGHFVRCPACGCPLERSSSPSTYAAYAKAAPKGDGTASRKTTCRSNLGLVQADDDDTTAERSGQTVKFCNEVSEVSIPANSMV